MSFMGCVKQVWAMWSSWKELSPVGRQLIHSIFYLYEHQGMKKVLEFTSPDDPNSRPSFSKPPHHSPGYYLSIHDSPHLA